MLLVVGLIHPLELVVALGDACDRDRLVQGLVSVWDLRLLARLQFGALVLQE